MTNDTKTLGDTRLVGPVPIKDWTQEQAIGAMLDAVARRAPLRVAFANAHTVGLAMRDEGYAATLSGMTVLADGVGVDLAARLVHGRPFPANLNGTDLTPALLRALPAGTRVYLLGGKPGIAARAAEAWRALAPGIEVAGATDGYGPMTSDPARAAAAVDGAGTDVLLVAMGNPLQEELIAAMAPTLRAPLALGVGALFDFAAGAVVRAPAPVRRVRAEFLWRLAQEPRRLGHRYTFGAAAFGAGLLRQRFGPKDAPNE